MTEGKCELGRLLLEQRDSLFAYINAMVRDWTASEELFQEVSLVILQKDKEGFEVRNFGAWSREIARRRILDYWRVKGRGRVVLSGDSLETLEAAFARHDEEGPTILQDLVGRLRSCLEKLPAHLRRIVDLRYRDDLSIEEMAQSLGRTSGAAQVALSRVRAQLHQCVKRVQEGEA